MAELELKDITGEMTLVCAQCGVDIDIVPTAADPVFVNAPWLAIPRTRTKMREHMEKSPNCLRGLFKVKGP